jgi:hypothetical protein
MALSRSAASSYLAAQLPAISQRSFQLSRSAASSGWDADKEVKK